MKCGTSQMKNESLHSQYMRDRLPCRSIIWPVRFVGPGIKQLYDSLLKKILSQYLFKGTISPKKKKKHTDLVDEVFELAASDGGTILNTPDPEKFKPERHELYSKDNLMEIYKHIRHIVNMSMPELLQTRQQLEDDAKIKAGRSHFITTKNPVFLWTADEIADIYKNGHSKGGSTMMAGGGSLALSHEGVHNLATWLVDFYKGFMGFGNENVEIMQGLVTQLILYWVGMGYAEEAVLLVLYVRRRGCFISLRIIGIDLDKNVVKAAERLIAKYNLTDYISISVMDVMNVRSNDISETPHIVYTSAAAGDIFDSKLLSLCISWKACLLCNVRCAELATEICGTRTHLLVNAWLHADGNIEQGEDRHIYLVKFPHKTAKNYEIVENLMLDLTVNINAETIRSFSCFGKFIEKMTHCAENGIEFDDDEIEMQSTPYSNFFPSVTIPIFDVNNIYAVYLSTTSDKLRRDAQVIFSEVLLSIIIDCTKKSIDRYFSNNEHAAAAAVNAAAMLPLPTQPTEQQLIDQNVNSFSDGIQLQGQVQESEQLVIVVVNADATLPHVPMDT